MTLVRVVSLIGVSLLVMVANIAMTFLYMVIYGYLINPGHPKEFYNEHVKIAGPYCSIVAGIPIMFLAGLWVAGWAGQQSAGSVGGTLGIKAALVVVLAYAVIDTAIVVAAGAMTAKLSVFIAFSLLTKLAAAYAGARLRLS